MTTHDNTFPTTQPPPPQTYATTTMPPPLETPTPTPDFEQYQYHFNDLDNLFDGFYNLSMPTIFEDPLFDGDAFLNADFNFADGVGDVLVGDGLAAEAGGPVFDPTAAPAVVGAYDNNNATGVLPGKAMTSSSTADGVANKPGAPPSRTFGTFYPEI